MPAEPDILGRRRCRADGQQEFSAAAAGRAARLTGNEIADLVANRRRGTVGVAGPLLPAERPGRHELAAATRPDTEAGDPFEAIGGTERESVVESAGDTHEKHPFGNVLREKMCRPGGRSHRAESAQCHVAARPRGGGQDRIEDPALHLGGNEDQVSRHPRLSSRLEFMDRQRHVRVPMTQPDRSQYRRAVRAGAAGYCQIRLITP